MRKFFLTITLIISAFAAFSQEDEPQEKEKPAFFEQPRPAWKDKLRYGGGVWAGFWGAFYIDVSPMVGYEVSDKGTVVGVGANLIYQGTFNNNGNLVYGPRLFIRQQLFRSIFAHAEYEMMNAYANQFYSFIPDPLDPSKANIKKWGGSPLIGVGFYQNRQAQRGSYLSLMYNLGYPNNGFISPQGLIVSNSPVTLRFGFLF
jgi:hypothetical protein